MRLAGKREEGLEGGNRNCLSYFDIHASTCSQPQALPSLAFGSSAHRRWPARARRSLVSSSRPPSCSLAVFFAESSLRFPPRSSLPSSLSAAAAAAAVIRNVDPRIIFQGFRYPVSRDHMLARTACSDWKRRLKKATSTSTSPMLTPTWSALQICRVPIY